MVKIARAFGMALAAVAGLTCGLGGGQAFANPTLVMRIDGRWDVVAFGPYRRIATGVSRAQALVVVATSRRP